MKEKKYVLFAYLGGGGSILEFKKAEKILT